MNKKIISAFAVSFLGFVVFCDIFLIVFASLIDAKLALSLLILMFAINASIVIYFFITGVAKLSRKNKSDAN